MLSKKLISLLETFSKHDLNRFDKYLRSPIINENEDLIRLFKIVDRALRSKKEQQMEQLNKKDVWKQLYGKKPYKDSRLRRLSSELTRYAYGFIAWREYQSDPVREQILLLSWLDRRHLDKHFNGVVRTANKLQEKKSLRDAYYHQLQYQVEEARHIHNEEAGKKIDKLEYLEKADYHLECYYLTRKLRHFCDSLDYKKSTSIKVEIDLPQAFLGHIKQGYLGEPSVKAYYLVAQMLMNPDAENHYRELKGFLSENAEKFSRSELNTLYIYLKNYCIDTKINEGREDYFKELFDIFKTLLEKEILLDNGTIDPQDYKNIITVGLHVEAFNWVEQFVRDYTVKLPEGHQDNAVNYNLAKLYFHQEKYEKVIELLREVEYKNLSYALGGKLMLLKTYYELDEQLVMNSLIESFRIYLQRARTISKDVKEQYLNVLKFVKQLSKIVPGDKKAVKKIRHQIKSTSPLPDKQWILDKVEELEG